MYISFQDILKLEDLITEQKASNADRKLKRGFFDFWSNIDVKPSRHYYKDLESNSNSQKIRPFKYG